jgi:protein TonB
MSYAATLQRVYELPWRANADQERAFKRILKGSLALLIVASVAISLAPVPRQDPIAASEVPPRLARLVVERLPPPPPPAVPEVAPEREVLPPEPVVVPEPPRVEQRSRPEPVPVAEPPTPADDRQEARARARATGLLPFAEQLASLRDDRVAGRLEDTGVRTGIPGPGDSPVAQRSLITSRVAASSGGIDTAALNRDTGGTGLEGRMTTRVTSPVEVAAPEERAAERSAESAKPARSRDEIERVFDRNKGAIYALYNRALRENPGLQGKVVLRLTIDPNGSVTSCEIVSSELGDPEFEQKLVQRVLLFQFDPKDVAPVTTTKPIDFFPA